MDEQAAQNRQGRWPYLPSAASLSDLRKANICLATHVSCLLYCYGLKAKMLRLTLMLTLRAARYRNIKKGTIIKTRRVVDGFGLVAAGALALILGLALPAQGQEEWLIAMGDLNSYRGTNVPSPDPNGHYWNAVDSGHYFPGLTNTSGQATSLALGFDNSNGNDSYNGPAGITFNPNDVVVNNPALGDLGYNYGVYHYYTSSGFEIQSLDPALKYNLTFFGSHAYSTDMATTYSMYTDSGYSNVVASVSLNVQVPGNSGQWNTNQVAVLNSVSPQANGIMYIGFYGANGTGVSDPSNLGYLNAMGIQVVPAVISSNSASSSSRGATVPWITYEAENMTNTGTILGPSYAGNNVASESSGRQCVQLSATNQYVQFTAQSNANAIVVRYSVPDTANGVGTNYTLSLYQNGVFVGKLAMTSLYSWLYGNYNSGTPAFSNNPGDGKPRNFYDEVRTNGLSISAGDVLRLQKDSTDTATNYVIDLVDLENVSAPISQPSGSVSIKSAPYNAVGDGITDDTTALTDCINANTSVYLPPGNYKITATDQSSFEPDNSRGGNVVHHAGRRSHFIRQLFQAGHAQRERQQHSSVGFCDFGKVELSE